MELFFNAIEDIFYIVRTSQWTICQKLMSLILSDVED